MSVLYMTGVGPGDPELLTLRAARLIREADILFVPVKKKESRRSLALEVVKKALDLQDKKIVFLYFPMVRGEANMRPYFEQAAREVKLAFRENKTGVFITIGCSTIYSTPGNLFKVLRGSGIRIRFVPGVSSINASAAAAGEPLVYSEDKLAVLPATYSVDELEETLNHFDRVVLMKAHSCLEKITEVIKRKGWEKYSYLIERASTETEKATPLSEIPEGYQPHYMSTVIIKRKG
ncbi:MAG: precorrin-2 C(20)-methyltransferase [bacterium]